VNYYSTGVLGLEMPLFWDVMYKWVEYVLTNVLGQVVLSFLLRVVHYA